MHRVQERIAALYRQGGLDRDKKDMRLVAAVLLIEGTARGGKIHRFSAANIPQKYNRIGYAAIGGNQQALKIAVLLAQRIANLRVFVDLGGNEVRQGSLPFHGSPDRSAILHGDDLIAILSGG